MQAGGTPPTLIFTPSSSCEVWCRDSILLHGFRTWKMYGNIDAKTYKFHLPFSASTITILWIPLNFPEKHFGPRTPMNTKCPLYKAVQYLHITHAHPPVYFKPSLDSLQCLIQCQCSINSCSTALFRERGTRKKRSVQVQYRPNHHRPNYMGHTSNNVTWFSLITSFCG